MSYNTIHIQGAVSEPGLNGTYLHNNQSYNGRPQYQKQNTRIYIRYSQERWQGWCVYVSHHPLKPGGEPGTAYFTNSEDVPRPPASTTSWKPSQCCFPNEKLSLSYMDSSVTVTVTEETKINEEPLAAPLAAPLAVPLATSLAAPLPAPQINIAIKFYTTSTCPFAQQIDIALKEMNIAHVVERIEVDIFAHPDEQFVAAYQHAYPEAPRRPSVPILEISDTDSTLHLTESSVILQYLGEMFDANNNTIPKLPAERAAMRLFVIAFQSSITVCISKILNATRFDSLHATISVLTQFASMLCF